MKFVDFFSGIGTIRLGMQQAGHECVYSVEWDKHKRQIYSIIFGGEPEGADICAVKSRDIPRADIWCYGAPCQDFSIAGKRAGMEGERSSLVLEVFRLVRETPEEDRPKYLLYENVKGMLSSNGGRDFLGILSEMASLGYDFIEYSLLNSKDFGVPQNRERVFTLGHLRGRSTGKVFPIGATDKATNLPIKLIAHRDGYHRNLQTFDPSGITETLDTGQGGGRGHHVVVSYDRKEGIGEPLEIAHTLNSSDWRGLNRNQKQNAVVISNGELKQAEIANCIDANYHKGLDNHGQRTGILDVRACLTPDRLEKRQNGRRFKEPGEPMFTLTTQDVHGVAISGIYTGVSPSFQRGPIEGLSRSLKANKHDAGVTDGCRIRKLTPKECWRLQGVPDEITDKVMAAGISDTQMYRGAGDACTVNVIYEIAKKLI